jgi:hypothetical protein
MLRQEFAFFKAISNIELSPVFHNLIESTVLAFSRKDWRNL